MDVGESERQIDAREEGERLEEKAFCTELTRREARQIEERKETFNH